MRLLFILAWITTRCWAVSCGSANVSLSNGWTLVDCNAVSAGNSPITLGLVHTQAVNKGDLLVVFADANMTDVTHNATIACTDNAGNTFTKSSLTDGTIPNNGTQLVRATNIYYVLGASANKASGYQCTCTMTPATGGTVGDSDMSIMVFRHTLGRASPGLNSARTGMRDGTSNSGAVPSLAVTPSGQTITADVAGTLIMCAGNTNDAPDQIDSPFVGVDGDGVFSGPAYYSYAATASSSGQSLTCKWYITNTSSSNTSGMLGFLPPGSSNQFPRLR